MCRGIGETVHTPTGNEDQPEYHGQDLRDLSDSKAELYWEDAEYAKVLYHSPLHDVLFNDESYNHRRVGF